MKDELTLLTECLDESALDDVAREAFTRMKSDLERGKWKKLTKAERSWVDGTHEKLGLDPGAANLVASGIVKPTEAERASLRAMVASLGPKVLKPPGHRE
jgi:hypothetical protein